MIFGSTSDAKRASKSYICYQVSNYVLGCKRLERKTKRSIRKRYGISNAISLSPVAFSVSRPFCAVQPRNMCSL